MIAIIGGFAGGLGLFYMGLSLLTRHIKGLADRRVRQSAAQWTESRWSGCVWGMLAGAITQTMPALTFVTVGMLRSGILTAQRAFPILIGGNVGGVLLLLILSFDVKLAVLYTLGMSQLITLFAAVGRTPRAKLQAFAATLFAMGMMVFGYILIKESVAPLASHPFFLTIMRQAAGSLLLSVLAGIVLYCIVQSGGVVMVTGIAMAVAGLLNAEQFFALYIGCCLGSSLSLYLFSAHLRGSARQTAMYQVLHNCVLAAVFLPLLMIETYAGVPLIKAALYTLDLPIGQLLPLYFIGVEIATGIVQILLLSYAEPLIGRWWPPTEIEELSQPRFIHDRSLDEANTALRMADLEQRRLLEIPSRCLDHVRQGTRLGPLQDSAKDVLTRIDEFLHDLACQHPDQEIDNQVSMLTRQRLLSALDERILKLCDLLSETPPHSHLEKWRMGIIEGIDAVLMVLTDMLNAEDDDFFLIGEQLINNRGELMNKMRQVYLGADSALSNAERTNVLQITSNAEHIFSLLSELVQVYQEATASERLDAVTIPTVVLPTSPAAPVAEPLLQRA